MKRQIFHGLMLVVAGCWNLALAQNWQADSLTPSDFPICVDQEVLLERFKEVKLIGMGESSHGTREFFQMRNALTAFLIEKAGVKAIYVEAANLKMEGLNRYVMGDTITLDSAFRQLNRWVLTVESMKEFVEWLREYNSGQPAEEKVQLMGIDQDNYQDAGARLLTCWGVLNSEAPGTAMLHQRLLLNKRATAFQLAKGMDADEIKSHESLLDSLSLVIEELSVDTAHQETWEELSYHIANLQGVWRYAVASKKSAGRGYVTVRDPGMARNTMSRLKQLAPGERAVLWAHNEHIETGTMRLQGMGHFIQQAIGEKYYALGMDFVKGSCTVFSPEQKKLVPQAFEHPKKGPSKAFPKSETCAMWIDLKDHPQFAQSKIRIHDVPAVMLKNQQQGIELIFPGEHFDGLLLVPVSTPTQWINVFE
ncbi:MAG: erythromycin esterase family protein [Bacteroidota bacterium]